MALEGYTKSKLLAEGPKVFTFDTLTCRADRSTFGAPQGRCLLLSGSVLQSKSPLSSLATVRSP